MFLRYGDLSLIGSKWPIFVLLSHFAPSIGVTAFEFRKKLYGS